MRINLIKLKFDNTYAYKYKPFEYCCKGIQENGNIVFTGEDFVDLTERYSDEDYMPIPQFCTSSTRTETSYGDTWEVTSNYPIQYCPHCGQKIEISVIGEIDLSDKYAGLEKERKEFWKKCQKTDSKKTETELRERISQLDRQINAFYQLAEYKEE